MDQKIKTLKTIHLAICAGVTLAYFFIGHFSVVSQFLFKSQLKQINPKLTIEEKMPFYQSASIVRWDILEGAAFLVLFVDPGVPVFGIFLSLYLVFLSPTADKITNDLAVNL